MMANLFSMFDPSTSLTLSLNWLFMGFVFFPFSKWWFLSSLILLFLYDIFYFIKSQLFVVKELLFFASFFLFMMIFNLLGLLPYFFPLTSYLTVTLGASFSVWLGILIFKMFNLGKFLAHFCPLNTPLFLVFFMILIETVSFLIQPITLSVRLMANIMAGHLILCLVSMSTMIYYLSAISLVVLLSLSFLELGVALIQSYVFTVLVSLYYKS